LGVSGDLRSGDSVKEEFLPNAVRGVCGSVNIDWREVSCFGDLNVNVVDSCWGGLLGVGAIESLLIIEPRDTGRVFIIRLRDLLNASGLIISL